MPNKPKHSTIAKHSSGPATSSSRNEPILKSFNDRLKIENLLLQERYPGHLTPAQRQYLELRTFDVLEDLAGTDPVRVLDLASYASLVSLQAYRRDDELFSQTLDNITHLRDIQRYFEDLRAFDVRNLD